jgi:hypothetical protein
MAPARKRAASPPVGMPTKRDDFGAPIDAYVDAVPSEQRPSFDRLRTIIEATVPDAQASLKWGTPCFSVDGKLLCAVAALLGARAALAPGGSRFLGVNCRLRPIVARRRRISLPATARTSSPTP